MRILQVTPSLYSGGGETLAFQLSEALVRDGHEVMLLSIAEPDADSPLFQRLAGSKFEFKSLLKVNGAGFDPSIPYKIVDCARAWAPDVVHTHLRALAYSSLITALNVRKIHTVHSLAEKECGWMVRKLYWALFRLGWDPVSISDAVQGSVNRIYGISSAIVENGVAVQAGSSSQISGFRDEIGVGENERIIVHVGRLTETKDQLLLLSAFERVADELKDVHLVFVGNDPSISQDYVRKLTQKRDALAQDIGARVHLLGLRGDVGVILSASEVFVLCSRYEGLPLSLLEAMALGKKCVCTSVGGVPDALDESSGWFLEDRDPARFADVLLDALADSRGLKERAALNRFDGRFSIEKCAAGYQKLYVG